MKLIALRKLLEELGARERLFEVEALLKRTEFLTKCNFLTKCLISSFLLLQNEGYPVVLEDILKFSRKGKIYLLSQIKRNRSAFLYSSECSLAYLKNVCRRLEEQLTIINYSFGSPLEDVIFLHKRGYFHGRSPFLPLLCLLLSSLPPKEILMASHQIIPDSGASASSIEREISRIASEAGGPPHKEEKQEEKRRSKIKQIQKALSLYRNPISSSSEYAKDYDSLLVEEMIKNGHHPMEIYHLTKKGKEYYSDKQ